MENNLGSISWLHGLQDYFEFVKDDESKKYIDFILKLSYADSPTIKIDDSASMAEFVYTLRKFSSSNILDIFYKYYRYENDTTSLTDAFSRGQVLSKIWLVTELSKIKKDFKNILLVAGWYGQLIKYFDEINYQQIRIVDLDRQACLVSDDIFNLNLLENYKVKAVNQDINSVVLNKNGYEFLIENFKNTEAKSFNQKFLPDLIINTSAEHMLDDWYNSIRFKGLESDPIIVIQSNNLFDIEEHINCVHSIDHMKKKFPMKEILYEGELQLSGYKRVMLIGRP